MARLWFLLLVLVAAAACGDAPPEHMRLVTLESPDRLGLSLRELPTETLTSLGLGYGLAVVRLSASAERAGLRVGDVVYGVNETRFRSLREFTQAIAEPLEGRIDLLVRRGRADLYVPVELGTMRTPDVLKGPRPATDTLLRT